jgi:deoxyribodipyrimidine photolyase
VDSAAVVWFRRDLRVHDHPALVSALRPLRRAPARIGTSVLSPYLRWGCLSARGALVRRREALEAWNYPAPIVDHAEERRVAMERYAAPRDRWPRRRRAVPSAPRCGMTRNGRMDPTYREALLGDGIAETCNTFTSRAEYSSHGSG